MLQLATNVLFAHTVRNCLRVGIVEVISSNVASGEVVTGRAIPSTVPAPSQNYPTANKTSPVVPTTLDTEVVPTATYHLAMLLP